MPRSNVIGRSSVVERPERADLAGFTELPYNGRRGLTGCQRHYDDAPSPAFYFGGTDYRAFRVIAALHDDVWFQSLYELEWRIFRENNDEVDAFHGGEHERTLRLAAYRPARALEPSHRLIAVDANDQRIGSSASSNQEIDVAGMKQIEDSVGERNPVLACSSPALGLCTCGYFCRGITGLQSLLITMGWKWRTRSFLSGRVITSS
jgi:hypothetical protein